MSLRGNVAAFCYTSTSLGDDIQAVAVDEVVGGVDVWVDRDRPWMPISASPAALVCQGWLTGGVSNWPPDPRFGAVVTSVHIADGLTATGRFEARRSVPWFLREDMMRWWKTFEPIGARDTATAELFESVGVSTYVSHCITLTLERERFSSAIDRSDQIVLIDVPDHIASAIAGATSRPIIRTSHIAQGRSHPMIRLEMVRRLLRLYADAHLVISPLLHGTLPCAALGTPTVLIKRDSEETYLRMRDYYSITNAMNAQELMAALRDPEFLEHPPPVPSTFKESAATLRRSLRQALQDVKLPQVGSAEVLRGRMRSNVRLAKVHARGALDSVRWTSR